MPAPHSPLDHDVLESHVQGIPCLVRITQLQRGLSGHRLGHPKEVPPWDPIEIQFEILDRKGYQAKWLERKATNDDLYRIEDEIIERDEREQAV